MKTFMVLLLLAGAAVAGLTGCVSSTSGRNAGPDPKALHHSGHSRLSAPLNGTFSVSYAPEQFTEDYSVRATRHRNISILIADSLERAGLKPTNKMADFEIRYTYRTVPAFAGKGFRHGFDLTVIRVKNATGIYADDLVWSGSAWIDRWPEEDITYLFAAFVGGLLEHFPEAPPKDQN